MELIGTLEQNIAVYAPITFEEIVIVTIKNEGVKQFLLRYSVGKNTITDHPSVTSSITYPNSNRTNVYTYSHDLRWLSTISRMGHYNRSL